MKFVLFYHSVVSCWNHGNAHFLRGIARELIRAGHDVTVYEPADGWSRVNALADGGADALAEAAQLVPGLEIVDYRDDTLDLDRATDQADVVLVHEWNTPALVAALGERRNAGARYTLLFHDTHHRAVTAADDMQRYDLDGYDGVLAFGDVLRDIYERRGWTRRAFTWHEAADTALFHPATNDNATRDLIWIGNWGDDERSRELSAFLIEPAARLKLRARVHGVRYPAQARSLLVRHGIEHAGWLPNHRAPQAFASARFTVHIPRRPYTEALPGIPTIRVFEALACGIPLICSPWQDCEELFPVDAYLTASDSDAMERAMTCVLQDRDRAAEVTRVGLRAVQSRHTCAHRVGELMNILQALRNPYAAKQHTTPQLGATAP